MKTAIRLPVSLLAAAAIAMPATSQRGDYSNPTKAELKSLCQPQFNAVTQMPEFNSMRFGGMSMLDNEIDVAFRKSEAELRNTIASEQRRLAQSDYPVQLWITATLCFYTRVIDHRASHAAPTRVQETYSSVCARNREKVQETLKERGLEAYAATYDLFNIDMNEKWVQLYQPCIDYDSTIESYEEFTREKAQEARAYCASGRNNPRTECTQYGTMNAAENQRYYEAWLIEWRKAMQDPNYSADFGPAEGPDGKPVRSAPPPSPPPPPPPPPPPIVANASPPPAPVASAPKAGGTGAGDKAGMSARDRALADRKARSGAGSDGGSSVSGSGGNGTQLADAVTPGPKPPVKGDKSGKGDAADKPPAQLDPITPEGQRLQMQASNKWPDRYGPYAKGKQRKMHFGDNDATPCIRVDATGNKIEWGVEGRYKLVNVCSYPLEVAWCANVKECNGPGGNLWTIDAGKDYPIFFSDETNPYIEVGACLIGATAKPLPGPYGSFSELHKSPHPSSAPGVHQMTKNMCQGAD